MTCYSTIIMTYSNKKQSAGLSGIRAPISSSAGLRLLFAGTHDPNYQTLAACGKEGQGVFGADKAPAGAGGGGGAAAGGPRPGAGGMAGDNSSKFLRMC